MAVCFYPRLHWFSVIRGVGLCIKHSSKLVGKGSKVLFYRSASFRRSMGILSIEFKVVLTHLVQLTL